MRDELEDENKGLPKQDGEVNYPQENLQLNRRDETMSYE